MPVVEYYHAAFHHYFMTNEPAEMAALDADERPAWRRTGGVFLAYPASATSCPAGAMPVCRFYLRPVAGVDSHFYSALPAECDHVRQNLAHAWLPETMNAFGAMLPDADGACPANEG
jgi:hypothetical protein